MAKAYDPILCMMVDEPTKAQDESYIVRGRKYKVVKRDGDNVTVIGPDGKVTKMHIDFLMSEGKKVSDSASALDKAIKACDANPEKVAELFKSYYNGRVTAEKLKNVSKSDLGALEWSVKQIPRLIKQGKPSHLINAENMQIERILKSYGII